MFRLLKTTTGPHPADRWALFTAEEIFDTTKMTEPGPWASRIMEARRIQLAIAEALRPIHAKVQAEEDRLLAGDAPERLGVDHDGEAFVADGVAAALGAIKGTEWEAHFARADVQAEMRKVLVHHFVTSQHVSRLWHIDRNPGVAGGAAYRARYQGA